MKFLVDANLSHRVAELLRADGHDAVAVREIGMAEAPDNEILERATEEDRILVSHDTDFATLIASRRLRSPSLILIRSSDPALPIDQAMLISANLNEIEGDLNAGAIAVFARGRLRVRRLPV
jgi:predicted nuclease of predicted toxin-antitoxin system